MADLILRQCIRTIAPMLDGNVKNNFQTELLGFLHYFGYCLRETRYYFLRNLNSLLMMRSFARSLSFCSGFFAIENAASGRY
ncbi:hypothetical protein BGV67_31765 [Burkholderia ubonensis]|nr:hypothetical protein WK98_24645 [Burkholderia ubonensis]KWO85109.1 hypothetical protein WM32_17485 [Burkholderia ubonensis]OJA38688.1 hypothetical protein BGV67_31765 [Burkholderia ubonensis]